MHKTTRGIVLREVKYKESDRLLTLLTDDMGKLTVKAPASVKRTGKAAASTQLFAFGELTMSEYSGRWQVTEGSVIEDFRGLREDISALALASYFAECTEAIAEEDSPDPQLLKLLLNCLFALSRSLYPQEKIKTAFEMRLMCLAGYEPSLDYCTVCGSTEPKEPFFSPQNGLVCCRDCGTPDLGASLRLCPASLNVLRHICAAEPKKILSFRADEDAVHRASHATETYLQTQTERVFDTLRYWKQVK